MQSARETLIGTFIHNTHGPPGEPGQSFFDIFIDDFFTAGTGAPGDLPVNLVSITEPLFGAPDGTTGETGVAAYRVAVPQMYDAGNDVTMRVSFHRTGPFEGGCFVFTVDAARLVPGTDVAPYGQTRWIRVDNAPKDAARRRTAATLLDGLDREPGIVIVIDLPVNTAAGLDYPADLAVRDLLAFELASFEHDGGSYHLLGVEFFESAAGTATLQNAVIFNSAAEVRCRVGECPPSRTYTVNADFDEGELSGLEHDTVPDQLQLAGETTTLPLMWIANAGEDTISKWDTDTNREVARYHTWFGPPGNHSPWGGPAPSRTAVDLDGNCYVANRHFDNRPADVLKILVDGFVDRNNNGVADTSVDSNGDGTITPDEMLPMTDSNGNGAIDEEEITDERVAWVAQVGPNGGVGRSLAIDREGNIWVGLYNRLEYYKISGVDGSPMSGPIDVSPLRPYGALVDRNGILWGASLSNTMLELDTATEAVTIHFHGGQNYGIALGRDDQGNTRVYLGSGGAYHEYDTVTETFSNPSEISFGSLGIATDGNGNIVAGNSSDGSCSMFAPDGSLIWTSPGQGVGAARGTVVDSNGDVWVIHVSNNALSKFRGSDGEHLGTFPTGRGPYTYSDATGLGLRTSFPSGTWTITVDATELDNSWVGSVISWTADVPQGTSVAARVRSSNDQITWSEWEDLIAGAQISTTPNGQFLQVQTSLRITAGEASPVLFDVTIDPTCGAVLE